MLAKQILRKHVLEDRPHHIARDGIYSEEYADAWHTIYQFPNGYRVSVVSGKIFYTDEDHPYELMITNSKDPDNDAVGHLDEFELLAKLVEVMEMEDING